MFTVQLFHFKDLFSTSLCTFYLSYNPVNTIVKKINHVHILCTLYFSSLKTMLLYLALFFNPHSTTRRINQSSTNMLFFSFCVLIQPCSSNSLALKTFSLTCEIVYIWRSQHMCSNASKDSHCGFFFSVAFIDVLILW